MLLTIALAGAGCQTARVDEPLTRTLGGNDPSDQLAFWHALSDRGIVCNDEGFHGLLLFLNGTDAATTYAQRIEALQARGLLGRGFDRGGTEALQRGTLAVALVKALGIKGGVLMHVVGPTPRYATRELRHLGIYGPDRPHRSISGDAFLDVMGRAEDYQQQAVPTSPASRISIGTETPGAPGRDPQRVKRYDLKPR